MEELKSIFEFFFDKRHHVQTRAGAMVLLVVIVLLLDNIMGFTYHYDMDRRISHAAEITAKLKDKTIPHPTRAYLEQMRNNALKRRNILDQGRSFWEQMSFTSQIKSSSAKNIKRSPIRNVFLHLVSSAGIYLLLLLIAAPIIVAALLHRFSLTIITRGGFIIMVLLCAIYFHYQITTLLPDSLFGSWTWNYIANIVIQLFLFVLYIYIINRIEQLTRRKQPATEGNSMKNKEQTGNVETIHERGSSTE